MYHVNLGPGDFPSFSTWNICSWQPILDHEWLVSPYSKTWNAKSLFSRLSDTDASRPRASVSDTHLKAPWNGFISLIVRCMAVWLTAFLTRINEKINTVHVFFFAQRIKWISLKIENRGNMSSATSKTHWFYKIKQNCLVLIKSNVYNWYVAGVWVVMCQTISLSGQATSWRRVATVRLPGNWRDSRKLLHSAKK